jgi:hypothetical protein
VSREPTIVERPSVPVMFKRVADEQHAIGDKPAAMGL